MSSDLGKEKKGFLDRVESIGNALPHPAMLFVILSALLIIISEMVSRSGVTVELFDPATEAYETIGVVSLMNAEGVRYIFNEAVRNFAHFTPLGIVLTAMIGVGVAEHSGLLDVLFKKILMGVNPRFLTAAVVFVGVISNIASDAGYVVVIPIGALLFAKIGRHPIAGLAAAFAGVSGGFSANIIFGPTDAMLAGITNDALAAAKLPYEVTATSNWYFAIASTILLVIVGTWVTERIVIPNLGEYTGRFAPSEENITDLENKGLRHAGIALILFLAVMAFLTIPESAMLKEFNPVTEKLDLQSFMTNGLIFMVCLMFMLPGLAYGRVVGSIKDSNEFVGMMTKSMEGMSGFIILCFFASQFVAYFAYTNVGTVLSVKGAEALEASGLTGVPLILLFIMLTAFLNLFVGSASAKWLIMAPIFVPMLASIGISPALTQMAYRIGDSTTNIISPLMNYFAMIVVFMQRYDEDSGIGTLVSTMLPYSMAFLISWAIFLILWMFIGLPLGPGAPLML